ncbi:DNA cross-link repair protein PSO2/SNM1, partial [Neurospora sp. IMI 360204]
MPPKSSSSSSSAGKLTSSSSKTPVKSARNRGYITKTPISSKPKPKPNASILNYFKKAADETLFIGEGGVGVEDLEGGDELEVEGGGEIEGDVKGVEEEKRFNELGGPSKKRRVSSDAEEEVRGKKLRGGEVEVKKEAEKEEVKPQSANKEEKLAVPPSSGAQSANSAKKPRRGPFLDDSDEEDEDEDEDKGAAHVKPAGLSGDEGREKREESTDKTEPKPLKEVTDRPRVPLLRQETSGARADTHTEQEEEDKESAKDDADQIDEDPQENKENHDNDLQGEELREKRYVQEQARLEAKERGFIGDDDDFDEMMLDDAGFIDEIEDDDDLTFSPADPEVITESCPICNASLAGVTSDQATAHVNACLDGNPTPLPPPTIPTLTAKRNLAKIKDESQESTNLVDDTMTDLTEGSKRFASRAAIARPGQANPFTLPGDDDDPNRGPDAKPQSNGSSAFSKLMSSHAESSAWATAAAAESASRGMPAYKRTCPFYKIMPNFSICIDAFRYGAVQGCKAYFLSHFHSDHYMGLSASWVHGPIYCSKVTGSLVKTQLRTAAKYVVELEFGETVPVAETGGTVMVTMIEANHCPGSSLFLFEKKVGKEGRTQRILHCGDFRACPAHVEHPLLKPETLDKVTGKTRQQKIDVCYLDTTYLNPRYSFPPQEDVIQACAEVCAKLDKGLKDGNEAEWERLLRVREGGGNAKEGKDVSQFFGYNSKRKGDGGITSNPTPPEEEQEDTKTKPPPNAFTALTSSSSSRKNRLLVVCGTYSIGKERICVAIAQALCSKIFASPSKIRITKQLGDPELSALMTSDPREAQVHMQALGEIRADTLAEYLELHRSNGFSRIVGFRPSGWSYRPGSGSNNNNSSTHPSHQIPPDLDTGPPASVPVTATLPPSSLPITHLLHGNRFRPRFFARNVVPQRGSGKEAMCFGVPYSEHSSFRELALFLMALR